MKNQLFSSYQLNDMLKTGIYKITCLINNKVYIGAASGYKSKNQLKNGFFRRWQEHISKLNKNKHANKHLQFAWNKYGENNFVFEILEFCTPEDCLKKELYYIQNYNACNSLYGFNFINQSNFINRDFSIEHRKKISDALKGRKRPLEVVQKWSSRVQQIEKSSNLVIAEYYSMAEASRKTGIQRQDIGQAIIGKKCKSAGGFYWKKIKT